jgi:hypothetical protein
MVRVGNQTTTSTAIPDRSQGTKAPNPLDDMIIQGQGEKPQDLRNKLANAGGPPVLLLEQRKGSGPLGSFAEFCKGIQGMHPSRLPLSKEVRAGNELTISPSTNLPFTITKNNAGDLVMKFQDKTEDELRKTYGAIVATNPDKTKILAQGEFSQVGDSVHVTFKDSKSLPENSLLILQQRSVLNPSLEFWARRVISAQWADWAFNCCSHIALHKAIEASNKQVDSATATSTTVEPAAAFTLDEGITTANKEKSHASKTVDPGVAA